MMKYLLLVSLMPFAASAQFLPGQQPTNSEGLVKWYTFQEAQELNKKNPRPFLVDVYTDWCGWCKHIIKTNYSDTGLSS
jgi:thiol:disulfide interchange protein